MFLKKYIMTSLAIVTFTGVSWCATQIYKIEPGWSSVEFSVTNFGIHTVYGRFKSFGGSIAYDDTDVTRSSASVSILVASIDTGIQKRDKHLQTAEFFEADKYADMTFKSERIEKKSDGYVMIGSLTMKGRIKVVELPFTYTFDKSAQGTAALHADASGTINRHDFGIDYGSNFSVGQDIKISLHIQALP